MRDTTIGSRSSRPIELHQLWLILALAHYATVIHLKCVDKRRTVLEGSRIRLIESQALGKYQVDPYLTG